MSLVASVPTAGEICLNQNFEQTPRGPLTDLLFKILPVPPAPRLFFFRGVRPRGYTSISSSSGISHPSGICLFVTIRPATLVAAALLSPVCSTITYKQSAMRTCSEIKAPGRRLRSSSICGVFCSLRSTALSYRSKSLAVQQQPERISPMLINVGTERRVSGPCASMHFDHILHAPL